MGVITYCLLAGFPPFRSVTLKGLKEKILYRCAFELPARALLRSLCLELKLIYCMSCMRFMCFMCPVPGVVYE